MNVTDRVPLHGTGWLSCTVNVDAVAGRGSTVQWQLPRRHIGCIAFVGVGASAPFAGKAPYGATLWRRYGDNGVSAKSLAAQLAAARACMR